MEEFLSLVSQTGPIVEPVLGGIVTTIFSLLFARKTAKIYSVEDIKAQQFSEIVSEMLADGKMSYMELYKCKNFLNIAKLADNMMKESASKEQPSGEQSSNYYDIDWFIRFFDSVGNVSNEDMQVLWAKVLKREIENANTFSLRTIETIHNLSSKEANLFTEITQFILHEQDGMLFLLDTINDFAYDLNEKYGISRDSIMLLQDCGLLGNLVKGVRIDQSKEPAGIWNDEFLLKVRFKRDETIVLTYKYNAYPLTSVGIQLYELVKQPSNNDYLTSIKDGIASRYSSNLETSLEKVFNLEPKTNKSVMVETSIERK